MKLNIERSVTVITPSIGSPKLIDAIQGVQTQTYKNVTHIVVADGPEAYDRVFDICMQLEDNHPKIISLPYNTGANGLNGQRIYASIPHLLDSDYIFFLDEDNWYEPDHVKSLVDTMQNNTLDWAYSFRKIYSENGKYIADDNCEALGKWPIYFSHPNPQYLIDTSAFAFRREFIQRTCHLWHTGAWGEDRRYFYAISGHSRWDASLKHTLCYRVGNNPRSVNGEFFIEGNKKQLEHYEGQYPWVKT